MTDRWIEMFHTLPNHPLLTRKGAAAPSPERPATQDAARLPGPAPQPQRIDDRAGEGDLAGLIRRCGAAPENTPVRNGKHGNGTPLATVSEPAAATEDSLSWMIARRATPAYEAPVRAESAPVRPKAARPERPDRAAAPQRRQLTVRLGMAHFVRFDRVARLTGRSYQDLQAEAIDRLLKVYHT